MPNWAKIIVIAIRVLAGVAVACALCAFIFAAWSWIASIIAPADMVDKAPHFMSEKDANELGAIMLVIGGVVMGGIGGMLALLSNDLCDRWAEL